MANHNNSKDFTKGNAVPSVYKKKTLKQKLKPLLNLFIVYSLYLRSYFLVERPNFIYQITLFLLLLQTCKPCLLSLFNVFYFWLALGSNLIFYDYLGDKFSTYILEGEGISLYWQLIAAKDSPNMIKRHITGKALSALVMGKTAMSSTGRATLAAGAITGTAWLFNSYLDRKAANDRADADRHAANTRAEADRNAANAQAASARAEQRAYDAYTKDHDAWKAKRFGKGPEPTYETYKDKFK